MLRSRLDLAILTDLVKIESATIEKCEKELLTLSELLKGQVSKKLAPRIEYLLDKVAGSQEKIARYEGESKVLKKVLQGEY